jgi:succinate dehydrogenase / fumarate reductase, iron-sulfur subunit
MAKDIHLKVKRQDGPGKEPYWDEFKIPYAPQHNVISVLMQIRENPVNTRGQKVAPVVWECNCMEEVCGACAMVINGMPRQACAALIDNVQQPIVLEPLSKFAVVRDLLIERQKMFDALTTVKAWVKIDHSHDVHVWSPRMDPAVAHERYIYSRCMTCGCCMEACPQFHDDSKFIGPAPLAQVNMHIKHPTGAYHKEERLHAIMGDGGLTDCGNAQNCVEVCPKKIPLTTAIGELGTATTIQWVKDIFRK